nr:hypothetical protein [Tanacetum cinerariifolium]
MVSDMRTRHEALYAGKVGDARYPIQLPKPPDKKRKARVTHQRKYPQWVSSSEVVSILNYQRALGSNSLLWKVISRFQVISGSPSWYVASFAKLEKFEGVDFRRWQKNMHFMLSSMSVVYVLTTSMPEDEGENLTMKQNVETSKELWDTLKAKYMAEDASIKKFLEEFQEDNIDYVCRCLILNGMSDSLFDIYQNVETSKELWDTLEAKYMAEDASIKKFLVSYFTNYKMINSRRVLEQYNELLEYLEELGSHLRIEKSLRVQDSDKPKRKNVVGPSVVNMVEHNNSSRYNDNNGKRTHHDTIANLNKKPKVTCWKCGKPGHLKEMFYYGNERFGGEPCFVPAGNGENEDEGYIITYARDEDKDTLELVIVDALSMKQTSIVKLPSRVPYGFHGTCIVKLPSIVPYGFHGTFVTSQDLANQ